MSIMFIRFVCNFFTNIFIGKIFHCCLFLFSSVTPQSSSTCVYWSSSQNICFHCSFVYVYPPLLLFTSSPFIPPSHPSFYGITLLYFWYGVTSLGCQGEKHCPLQSLYSVSLTKSTFPLCYHLFMSFVLMKALNKCTEPKESMMQNVYY